MTGVTYRFKRGKRGSLLLFYALIIFPTMMLALALSADVTRVTVAHRQLATAVNSSASAAAWGVPIRQVDKERNEDVLDAERAEQFASSTFCQSWLAVLTIPSPVEGNEPGEPQDCAEENVNPNGIQGTEQGLRVTFLNSAGVVTTDRPTRVQAQATADVRGLFLLGFVTSLFSSEGGTQVKISADADAEVCVADAVTGKYLCPRPSF